MSIIQQDGSPLDIALGEVLPLPCKFIESNCDESPILVRFLSQELSHSRKNIVPVIVEYLEEDRYRVVCNGQILSAAKLAGLDFVNAIIVNSEMLAKVEMESGIRLSVDITKASQEDIESALEFLKERHPDLKRVDCRKAAQGIVEYRTLREIQSLNFLATLKCGIGKAKIPLLTGVLKYPEPQKKRPSPKKRK